MPLKKQYQIIVNEMIKHGDRIKAYQKAYPGASKETARVESYRILQIPTVAAAIKKHSEEVTSMATQEAKESLKKEIIGDVLTSVKKREILHKIAMGDLKITTTKFIWNPVKKDFEEREILEIPDHAARMKAIDLDNKMAGDYAPEQKDLNIKGSFLDFLMQAE